MQLPDDVARQALDQLGVGPTCVPGGANRQAAAYLWPRSRVAVSSLMSRATAEMYSLPVTKATGHDFAEDAPGSRSRDRLTRAT